MSVERKKILEMLAEGKISAEDAERLLDKVSGSTPEAGPGNAARAGEAGVTAKKPRYLRILVERPGEDNVNVRVPLAFTRTGSRLLAVLPRRGGERVGGPAPGRGRAALGILTEAHGQQDAFRLQLAGVFQLGRQCLHGGIHLSRGGGRRALACARIEGHQPALPGKQFEFEPKAVIGSAHGQPGSERSCVSIRQA